MNEVQRLLEISRVHLARSSYCVKRGHDAAAATCMAAAIELWRRAVMAFISISLFGESE